jgi:hypothetical protein
LAKAISRILNCAELFTISTKDCPDDGTEEILLRGVLSVVGTLDGVFGGTFLIDTGVGVVDGDGVIV